MNKNTIFSILVFSFLTCSLAAYAQQNKPSHLFSVGTDGLGMNLTSFKTKVRDKEQESTLDESDSTDITLNLNYRYLFENNLMLGFGLYYSNEEQTDNNNDIVESTERLIQFSIGYNFNDDFYNSFWIEAFIALGEVEFKSGGTKTKLDGLGYGARFGKRFSFAGLGLKNLSYSPSISYIDFTLDQTGPIESTIKGFEINLLQFDYLF